MSLYNPSPDAPRPKTVRYVFDCPGCGTMQQVEQEELKAAGVDFMRLEYRCTTCRRLALITVSGEMREFKVWAEPSREVRAYMG